MQQEFAADIEVMDLGDEVKVSGRTTIQGDMWDKIAYARLGDTAHTDKLMNANLRHREYYTFTAGIVLVLPDIPENASDTPPLEAGKMKPPRGPGRQVSGEPLCEGVLQNLGAIDSFGTYQSADISRYTDVPRGSWHYDCIAPAVHMGTFAGYSSSRMRTEDNITREQAIVVLARTVCLPSAGNSVLARFPNRNQVGAWAADRVAAIVERGYVSGYNDGRLNPKGQITRAEMAQIMCNIFQSVHDSGDLTGTYRDTILVRGTVNIKDAVFESDLILANGLGEKTLDLKNITAKGRLVV